MQRKVHSGIRVFNLSCGRVVYRVEKSKVLMEDTWEKDLDFRLSKRSLEFFKIHMWFMPLRKSYYFKCLIKELGMISNTSSNTTYKPTSFDKDEILANHRSFMTSLNIPSGKESEDFPYLYLYVLFLLCGFLICHAVGWYIELKNQKIWWRIPERKILISGYPKDL
jgi:hypothetical protein